ncbi:MAG: MgtC/SapB family protein, partial [Bacteriovoracaceae bacterium]|nr:MgtC/SapB family protein [Bacteriovoracaceae bacterium]
GATLYTTISLINLPNAVGLVDPSRVAAQMVRGIGFLGAGAIIQGRGNVTGLTTAATIWVVAAIGFTIGVGFPFVATLFSITVLVVLRLLAPIHKYIERESEHKDFHIEVMSIGTVKKMASKMFLGENIELEEIFEEEPKHQQGRKLLHIFLTGHPRAIDRISQELNSIMKVEKVSYRQVESAQEMYEVLNKSLNRQM